jgi:hypothetical protein
VNPWVISALSFASGVIFSAGILFARIMRISKDVNGLGGRSGRFERNMVLTLMVVLEKREDRQVLAEMLRQQ